MFRTIRNVHLFAGLLGGAYLLMYAWSSVQMSHREWFEYKPVIVESEFDAPGLPENPRQAAREVMVRRGIDGELRQLQPTGDGFRMRVAQLGSLTDVTYVRSTGKASVRETRQGFGQTLNQMHHVAGLFHETWRFQVMGWFVAIVSLGLAVLAATGIYLWFKIHQERLIGGILLALNLLYCGAIIATMRMG